MAGKNSVHMVAEPVAQRTTSGCQPQNRKARTKLELGGGHTTQGRTRPRLAAERPGPEPPGQPVRAIHEEGSRRHGFRTPRLAGLDRKLRRETQDRQNKPATHL